MYMYAPRFQELLHDGGAEARGAIFITRGACCPIPGVRQADLPASENLVPVFEEELRTNPNIDRVVIAAIWHNYLARGSKSIIEGIPLGSEEGRQKAIEAFGGMVGRIVASGKRVVVVLAVPSGAGVDPNQMLTRTFLGGQDFQPVTLTEELFRKVHGPQIDELASVAKANGAHLIDPLQFLCRDGMCMNTNEDGPIRSDRSHLRVVFVRNHVTYLDATVSDGVAASATATVAQRDAVKSATKPSAWQVSNHQSAKATLAVSPDGVMKVDIGQIGDGKAWQIQLFVPDVSVKANERYTVSFRAKAAEPRTIVVKAIQGQQPWESLGLFKEVSLTEAWQNFQIDFQANFDETKTWFGFNLGSDDATVEFADVAFRPADAGPDPSAKNSQNSR
jgi:hypothetical protein